MCRCNKTSIKPVLKLFAVLWLTTMGCGHRDELTPDTFAALQRHGRVRGLHVYAHQRFIVEYDDEPTASSVNKKSSPGIIVGIGEFNAVPLLWVSFSSNCVKIECSFGFVQTEDHRFKLMLLPNAVGANAVSGIVYYRHRRTANIMRKGKKRDFGEVNEIYILRRRHRSFWIHLEIDASDRRYRLVRERANGVLYGVDGAWRIRSRRPQMAWRSSEDASVSANTALIHSTSMPYEFDKVEFMSRCRLPLREAIHEWAQEKGLAPSEREAFGSSGLVRFTMVAPWKDIPGYFIVTLKIDEGSVRFVLEHRTTSSSRIQQRRAASQASSAFGTSQLVTTIENLLRECQERDSRSLDPVNADR